MSPPLLLGDTMFDQQIEFLDMLAIVSFSLQMELIDQMNKQATNDDIINHLHQDLVVVDRKLDAIMKRLDITLE